MTVIDLTIVPREKDLGGFTVRRVLPYMKKRMIGPFIFLDHLGPAQFGADQGIDVRPHPHIGLATVTYLFEGRILHRDTLGSTQEITPGAVNWMTAGRGIAHSERTPLDEKNRPHKAHGLQSWVALPKSYEEMAPEFHHHESSTLPEFKIKDVTLKLISGRAYGHEAPVKIYSPLFYVEAKMPAGSKLQLPAEYKERAIYVVSGEITIGGDNIAPCTMPVLLPGGNVVMEAKTPAHIMLLGGEPLSEPRYIDWNFVSSSHERIIQAGEDWKAQKFGKIPGDDKEFIPLPELSHG